MTVKGLMSPSSCLKNWDIGAPRTALRDGLSTVVTDGETLSDEIWLLD